MQIKADIVIIGASTGGCAAALSALRLGRNVVLTEATDWIGGQLTSQGVPADEHRFIETSGCTASYRQFRALVRDYYKRGFALTPQARSDPFFNPGNAAVGRLSADPRVCLATLEELLAPYACSGQLTLLLRCTPQQVLTMNSRVAGVILKMAETGEEAALEAAYYLDATDCGDLLPLSNAEYVCGAESQADTGELHALSGPADPLDMQAVSHCFAVDYIEGMDFTIDRPREYDFWKDYQAPYWPDRQLSMITPHHITHRPLKWTLFGEDGGRDMFQYRRIADKANFIPGAFAGDVTIINVPQTDYFLGTVFDHDQAARHLESAKQLSLSFLYWLQTSAPRPDGKLGYPGLRLRRDVMGTADGLAKSVYIRESRRMRTEFTILEQHVGKQARGCDQALQFTDSVGIGLYRIDLHPSTTLRNYIDIECLPFQIPLGSLIPVRMENLLPACKNIGTTHITNGCYRLHPVEWNIGESAGALASYCVETRHSPRSVSHTPALLNDFQALLTRLGIELRWQ